MTSTGSVAATTLNQSCQTLGLEMTRPCRRPKGHSLPRTAPPLQDGTQLDDHAEHGHELFTGVELYHLFRKIIWPVDEDGQPLGDALHDAHQDRFDDLKKHIALLLPYAGRTGFCDLIVIPFQYTIFRLSAHQEFKNFISGVPYSFSIYLRGKICYTGM